MERVAERARAPADGDDGGEGVGVVRGEGQPAAAPARPGPARPGPPGERARRARARITRSPMSPERIGSGGSCWPGRGEGARGVGHPLRRFPRASRLARRCDAHRDAHWCGLHNII